MLFRLNSTLRSLTRSPAANAIDQARRMAQRRLAAGGAAVPASKQSDDQAPADFVLPADVDAAAVAAGVREKLGVATQAPGAKTRDPLYPLERRLGGRVVVRGYHILRLGDGRFDRGKGFMRLVIADLRARRRLTQGDKPISTRP